MPSKILLVDDEPKECFKSVLETVGLSPILLADNGEEALEVIERERPNLLVLNLLMPKMGGEEVLKVLKAKGLLDSIGVIIWTGFDDGLTRERILSNYSIDYYLDKPIDMSNFVDKVKLVLSKRQKPPQDINQRN